MKSIIFIRYGFEVRFLWGLGALEDDDWDDFTGLTGRSSRLDLGVVWEWEVEDVRMLCWLRCRLRRFWCWLGGIRQTCIRRRRSGGMEPVAVLHSQLSILGQFQDGAEDIFLHSWHLTPHFLCCCMHCMNDCIRRPWIGCRVMEPYKLSWHYYYYWH